MKAYHELTPEQQQAAVDLCFEQLAADILAGVTRFDDAKNDDTFQATIDASLHYAAKFIPSETEQRDYVLDAQFRYVMDTDGSTDYETIRDHILGMASCDAELAVYTERNDGPRIALESLGT